MDLVRLRQHIAFDPTRAARHRLVATPRCQVDLYCLAPGQAQAVHTHADQDKLYLGVEGAGRIRVGREEELIEPGVLVLAPAGTEHGLANPFGEPLVVLVLVAPPPSHA